MTQIYSRRRHRAVKLDRHQGPRRAGCTRMVSKAWQAREAKSPAEVFDNTRTLTVASVSTIYEFTLQRQISSLQATGMGSTVMKRRPGQYSQQEHIPKGRLRVDRGLKASTSLTSRATAKEVRATCLFKNSWPITRTSQSGQFGSFQLAKTRSRMSPH